MLIKKLQGPLEKRDGYYYEFDTHSQPVGEGGMGVVYKGFKIYETTGNRSVVAIKVMFEGLPAEVYERAERESSIRLRNDNLVEMLGFISEVEIDPFGVQKRKYFVISEYLNGVVLSDLLAGRIKDKDGIEIPYAKELYTAYVSEKEKTSVEIIRCVLSGILALHDKGYIHRDIDPTNIMVTDEGTIKLIDFGIAKYVRSLGTMDKSLTSTGKFIGKAEFASPELVLGDVRNQGYQTDIYAIGILFYQLLVGKLPFTGSKYEVLQMQLNNKVPVKHIKNPSLAKVVKKATEKNKSDRYASVAELRVDMDKAVSSVPTLLERYWKQGVLTVVASVACALLIFWVGNRKQNGGDVQPNDSLIAVDEKKTEKNERKEIDHSEDFQMALAKLNSNDKRVANEGLSLMKQLADQNCAEAKNELGVTYCTYSKAQSSTVRNRRDILELNNNISEDLSLKYLENIQTTPSVSVDGLYVLGYSYWRNEKYGKGAEVLARALALLSESADTTFNGFSKQELASNIKKYLELCNEQIRK